MYFIFIITTEFNIACNKHHTQNAKELCKIYEAINGMIGDYPK